MDRPNATAELRAWIAVGITLVLNLVGGTWWAAGQTKELQHVRELLIEMRDQMNNRVADHEARIRTLEAQKK